MKKLLSIVLSLVMIAGMFSFSTPAYALDVDKSSATDLYIATKSCPNEYIEYAKANIQDFIMSVDPSTLPDGKMISVGSPFCFANSDSDIFYFPVLFDNEITYMLRVFPKSAGGYGGVLGKSFVKELNSLASKTTPSAPLFIMMEGDCVVSYISGKRYVILEYPDGSVNCDTAMSVQSLAKSLSEKDSQFEIVNAFAKDASVNYAKSVNLIKSLFLASSETATRDSNIPAYKYLSTSITETQGGESWCAAYATAMIVRFVKGNNDDTEAVDVMNYHFDNPSASDAIGEAEVVEYANSRSLRPTHVKYTLSDSSLMSEVASESPVYLRMYRVSGTDKIYHAVVLRGYSTYTDKWSIWNPWYDEYDSFDMGGTYVPAEHSSREYTYCHTIYNW